MFADARTLAQPERNQVNATMTHGEFIEKRDLAKKCCIANNLHAMPWKEVGIHHATFDHLIKWMEEIPGLPDISHPKHRSIHPELSHLQDEDVFMMCDIFGFSNILLLRDYLVNHFSANSKLANWRGSYQQLKRLMELADLPVVMVGDRPYVHWKQTKEPQAA
jgi:hypothetical protein